jgi:hypothetical protein
METSKPLWLKEPNPNETSVRFCCPHCFTWVRNSEFEEHVKLAHPEISGPRPGETSQTA